MNFVTEEKKEIFFSTPISSFTPKEFSDFKVSFNALQKNIELNNPEYMVFCAMDRVSSLDALDDSTYSVIGDFKHIDSCAAFILFYPRLLATSALVELGYALALQKSILIISPDKNALPFLCRQMDTVFEFVEITHIDITHDKIVQVISGFIENKVLTRSSSIRSL